MKSKIMKRLCVVVGMLVAYSMAGELKDSRDGKTYKTVKIGNQEWMAENLNYKTNDSYCYKNDEDMCKKYGRLYDLAAADKACPDGWHLPNDDEWNVLWKSVGGKNSAGKKLKSKRDWKKNGNGMDSFGFAVLPAGDRDINGYFSIEGGIAHFWSSSYEKGHDWYGYTSYWSFFYDEDLVARSQGKSDAYSIRCLKDSSEEGEASSQRLQVLPSSTTAAENTSIGTIKDSRDGKTYKTVKIGNQTWMAENLNYETDGSWCYGDAPANCRKYGRLYTWNAANKACPNGWHLPNDDERRNLEEIIGSSGGSFAGKKLKTKSGWFEGGNGKDSLGFAVLPAGFRGMNDGFKDEGKSAIFWSSTKSKSNVYDASSWSFTYDRDYMSHFSNTVYSAFSVRCLKD